MKKNKESHPASISRKNIHCFWEIIENSKPQVNGASNGKEKPGYGKANRKKSRGGRF